MVEFAHDGGLLFYGVVRVQLGCLSSGFIGQVGRFTPYIKNIEDFIAPYVLGRHR
jgi:hypothetical protein